MNQYYGLATLLVRLDIALGKKLHSMAQVEKLAAGPGHQVVNDS
jgi:hypothetical protein